MNLFFIDCTAALWLGILTSISPCPLTTNIAAVSYIGRRIGKTRMVLLSGLLYTAGRSAAYLGTAFLISLGIQSVPGLSLFLQKHMALLTGPVLLVTGILLLGILPLPAINSSFGTGIQKHVDSMGIIGALLLGVLFALAFCPVSAGLFFGGLMPLYVKHGDTFIMPALYGIGTAVPVLAFALTLAFAANRISVLFNRISAAEKWSRRITAAVMLVIGIYQVLKYNFGFSAGI